jgi:UDP-N-acetylmuramoyl-tripeptide--D-alanyl-D-alanine ligase
MSALWTHIDAAKATCGTPVGEWAATGLSIDTRTLRPGDLFIPLKDIRDGHEFIPMAYEKGAAAVLSEKPISGSPALIVDNAQTALEDLARAKRHVAKRVAVTGSVGKTSVKEMIACICRAAGKTHASIKSYNNHWGVPLTMAGMPDDTEYGVFEMGMNHKGELEGLSQMVEPHIAIITKIAPAHLAHFASIDEIAEAKSEVFSGLAEKGMAIIPDNSGFNTLFVEAIEKLDRSCVEILTFGTAENADGRIIKTTQSPTGSQSVLTIDGQAVELSLPIAGTHWVENAACALLATSHLGIDLDVAATALKDMHKIPGRGELHLLQIDGNEILLIDESYNANPESMRAAIATLGLQEGRKIAVLGDMLELGDTEAELHAGLLAHLNDADIDLVMTCGRRMQALHDVLPAKMDAGGSDTDLECLDNLLKIIENGDVVMVKGSNASGMSKLVSSLINKNDKKGNTHVL